MKQYYHLFANGDDSKNFITSEDEFVAAFNRIALCAHLSGATVLSFSIEDSHPHALLYGTYEECWNFKTLFENNSLRSIKARRGTCEGVRLDCDLYVVDDENYLRNVATYTIIQATKDGKAVMPYDYRYGTGALYFRSEYSSLPWLVDRNGRSVEPVRFDQLSYREKRRVSGSREDIPGDWLVCNGFILPTNYVDIARYEAIFRTHNCFRVFLSSGKDRYAAVLDRMATVRGLTIEDLEARNLCEDACLTLFGRKGTRHLTPQQRLALARELRRRYHLSYRQLSTLTKLPENELREYVA